MAVVPRDREAELFVKRERSGTRSRKICGSRRITSDLS